MQPESAVEGRQNINIEERAVQSPALSLTSRSKPVRRGSLDEARERQTVRLQRDAFYFLLFATTLILASVLLILFFQGFALNGFNLSTRLLYVLTGATIVDFSAAFYFIVRILFGGTSKQQSSTNRE